MDAATLRELWARRDLVLVTSWPVAWVAPDGSTPQPLPPANDTAPAAPLTSTAAELLPPPDAPALPLLPTAASTPPPPPEADPAPAAPTPPPEPAAAAPQPEPPPPHQPRPVKLRPVDPRHAAALAILLGHGAEASKRRGIRPASPDSDLGPGLTLERLFDLVGFVPSAVQRALARAADGRPVGNDLDDAQLTYHFGTPHMRAGIARALVIFLRSGIRAGKTYIAALGVLKSALTCGMRRPLTAEEVAAGRKADADGLVNALQPSERARVVFVTPKAEQSKQAFGYVVGAVQANPRLAKYIVAQTTETLVLRRPCDGVEVLFEMVAASPRGNNVRSGWLAAAMFDEAAFFAEAGAAVDLKDNLDAARTRMLPGAQVWLPSSPWADAGTWHEEHKEAFGKPSRDALAFHSDTLRMNPAFPDGAAVIARARAKDPLAAAREYDATPLSAVGDRFFPEAVLALAINHVRPRILPPGLGYTHYAGADTGFRRNSSALAIAYAEGSRVVLAYMEELIPPQGAPLVPSEVCGAFGRTCLQYGAGSVLGDRHSADSAKENFAKIHETDDPASRVIGGIDYDDGAPSTTDEITAMYGTMRDLAAEGRLDLPDDPRLLAQIRGVLGKPTGAGRMQIVLPKHGRAHGDLLVSVALAVKQAAVGASGGVGDYDARWDASGPRWDSAGL